MTLIRKLAGMALGLVAFLAGCWSGNGGGGGQLLYGVTPAYGMPPVPHDPSVTLDDFSYTPPSPVSPGDTLEFTATTNKPTTAGWLTVTVGDPTEFSVWLNDIGIAPDDVPNDGIWHGAHDLPADATPAQDMPTTARLTWEDGAEPLELAGEDLTILEEGE